MNKATLTKANEIQKNLDEKNYHLEKVNRLSIAVIFKNDAKIEVPVTTASLQKIEKIISADIKSEIQKLEKEFSKL
jgi:hypothetical protein